MTYLQEQENRIECAVERMIDRLDTRYLNEEFDDSYYDEEMARISAWADREYSIAASKS